MPTKPFVLSVKAIICDREGRCLLVRRSSANRNFAGCWEWPGGKVESGEDFVQALIRETREETGLEIEITGFVGATQFELPGQQVIELCMEARPATGNFRLSDEHDDVAWVWPHDFSHHTMPDHQKPFMLAWAARSRRPDSNQPA